jgi:hypothetical protein
MQDNRVLCYSVKVEVPSETGQSASVYNLVRTNSETAATDAIEEATPSEWRVAAAIRQRFAQRPWSIWICASAHHARYEQSPSLFSSRGVGVPAFG